jgi:hypothetical protein
MEGHAWRFLGGTWITDANNQWVNWAAWPAAVNNYWLSRAEVETATLMRHVGECYMSHSDQALTMDRLAVPPHSYAIYHCSPVREP